MRLKNIASKGGKNGPFFDLGILSVIEQIERTGTFVPNPIKSLEDIQRAIEFGIANSILTKDEIADAERTAKAHGMMLEEAGQYGAGVAAAENSLFAYAKRRLS